MKTYDQILNSRVQDLEIKDILEIMKRNEELERDRREAQEKQALDCRFGKLSAEIQYRDGNYLFIDLSKIGFSDYPRKFILGLTADIGASFFNEEGPFPTETKHREFVLYSHNRYSGQPIYRETNDG